MTKLTRTEFVAHVKSIWPGATQVEADRGLYVVVGSEEVAKAIAHEATTQGYRPVTWEQREPEDFLVRIFGFPRGR